MKHKILEVNNLSVQFSTYAGIANAVRDVSFEVNDGEFVAIVGESGSGKSVLTQSLLRLLPTPPAKITSGEVLFENQDLLKISDHDLDKVRGRKVSVIFQDAMTALNPTMKIGDQITEVLLTHSNIKMDVAVGLVNELTSDSENNPKAIENWLFRYFYTDDAQKISEVKAIFNDHQKLVEWAMTNSIMSKQQAKEIAIHLLEMVKIPNPEKRISQYVYQFSGGMRQRAMIAMALACRPKLLIADEPTTALDVTIKSDVMQLMVDLVHQLHSSIILITHDLGVVASHADRIIVMYAGKIVETGTSHEIFYNPQHPYTKGLLAAVPRLDSDKSKKLETIDGTPPNIMNLPKGCAFASRCKECMRVCISHEPIKTEFSKTQQAYCWMFDKRASRK